MREKDRKIKEAREALRASERAEWQSKVADALESFEMGGLDQTHSEMVNKLNEQTARNEARMEIALESVDTATMEIEANAEKLRAQELVNQFKQEMGKETPATGKEKTIEIDDDTGRDERRFTKNYRKGKNQIVGGLE
jgi:phage shock protein A